ncbi:Festuclavine dehydrogenase [Daldinia childiae]|uniref:Festuclavine dehydrogenase n=1 Tax=Daldinia childiae TaxID=326645 RepID=UPI0014486571|nr:Festuclavine dehydrogenase [Daldinia childiae]KAF3067427.1 Festuclavine dehydrogenase [Daldinia childiae]
MSILLTGGSGKTAPRVAALLAADKKPFLLGSRQEPSAGSNGHPTVKFDMSDESTWTKLFESTQIKAVYMMEPRISEPWVPMNKFIDLAKKQGVNRFVLCAGTSATIGKDGMGRVWEHLIESGVDYCVLRPSWFMENLIEPGLAFTIGKLNKIFTAAQGGKIPFISAADIAEVAYHALTDEKSYNCDLRVLGPENLTYDQIAETLSKVLGRKIEHVKLDEAGRIDILVQAGLSEYFARFLTRLEVLASQDFEKGTSDAVERVTGHPPQSFAKFAEENKAVWSSN